MTPALMVRHSLVLAHTVTRVKTTEPNYSCSALMETYQKHTHIHTRAKVECDAEIKDVED